MKPKARKAKSTVIRLAEKSDNANFWTVKEMLEDAVKDISEAEPDKLPTKAIVLTVGDRNGAYDVHFVQAGMKMTEVLALLEVAKIKILKEMNYIA